jgi:hypothetical protein
MSSKHQKKELSYKKKGLQDADIPHSLCCSSRPFERSPTRIARLASLDRPASFGSVARSLVRFVGSVRNFGLSSWVK